MRDREMVNRFCAFQLLGVDGYKGDMNSFLAAALEKMNSMPQAELENLSAQFRNSVKNNHIIFDRYAFRKHTPHQENRGTFNVSLWDVMTTGLSNYPEHLIEARAASIRNAFYPLLEDTSFDDSITLGTNQVAKVKTRFSKVREMLTGVLDD